MQRHLVAKSSKYPPLKVLIARLFKFLSLLHSPHPLADLVMVRKRNGGNGQRATFLGMNGTLKRS